MHCVLDTEVYQNYFLATFMFEDGRIIEYEKAEFTHGDVVERGDLGAIVRMLMQEVVTLVTFNGIRYDVPILSMACMGASNGLLKEASNLIIKRDLWPWDLEKRYHFNRLQLDHIDIINLLPLFQSLKLYAARNGAAEIEDLPFDPEKWITEANAEQLRVYCRKDCTNTWGLFIDRWEQIQLRIALGRQYQQDLRSKSDAQIAEAVIKSEYERILDRKLVKPIDEGNLPSEVSYEPPAFLVFRDRALRSLIWSLSQWSFRLSPAGKPEAPSWLKKAKVEIADRKYTVGLGGLHAYHHSESYRSDDQHQIVDLDVTSYYPATILNNGYVPPHMGDVFTRIFKSLVDQRIEAKRAGDKVTADTLKITINGTFGKLGSKYSAVYAPELMLGVTFSGQLSLLMLIEMMAEKGVQCVSANTDGVTLKVKRTQLSDMREIVSDWESLTGYEMEETEYKSIHYRDVNNYFAETTDGKLKTKGIFKDPDVTKNPVTPVVAWAAIDYVLNNTPIEQTIDLVLIDQGITPFLAVRTVKGGGEKDGEYLGKAVRWYYSTATDTAINYISNGNKVADTDGAMPMMDLGPVPDDLDKQWYIDKAIKTVKLVGEEYIEWL